MHSKYSNHNSYKKTKSQKNYNGYIRKKPLFSVSQFQDFVLDERNIESILNNIYDKSNNNDKLFDNDKNAIDKKYNSIKASVNKLDDEFLTPRYKDTLFWCFYIMENGITNYEMIHSDGFKESMQYKIYLVEQIRKHKDILKKYKFKKNKVETDLVNSLFIDLSTFMCICAVHNYNIVVIDGRKYYKLFQTTSEDKEKYKDKKDDDNDVDENDTTDNICIIEKKHGKYRLCIGDQKTKLDIYNECLTNKWEITNINKPLNAISGYKLKDLQDICKKLGINIYNEKNTFVKKAILYQSIQKQL